MSIRFNGSIVASLFGFALLAGCTIIDARTDADSTSARQSGQPDTETKPEATKSKSSSRAEPPTITYRPGM